MSESSFITEKKITIQYTILFLNTGIQEQFDQALLCLGLVRLLKHILQNYKVDQDNWLICAKIGADMHMP